MNNNIVNMSECYTLFAFPDVCQYTIFVEKILADYFIHANTRSKSLLITDDIPSGDVKTVPAYTYIYDMCFKFITLS